MDSGFYALPVSDDEAGFKLIYVINIPDDADHRENKHRNEGKLENPKKKPSLYQFRLCHGFVKIINPLYMCCKLKNWKVRNCITGENCIIDWVKKCIKAENYNLYTAL